MTGAGTSSKQNRFFKKFNKMNNLKLLLIAIITTLSLPGCFNPDTAVYNDTEKMLESAMKNVDFVKAEKLDEMMQYGAASLTVIDLREFEEFEAGHIPGALNIPRGTLEFSNLLSNRRQTVVLYCNTHERSALSVRNLKLMKYKDVRVLEGGFENWRVFFPEKIEEGPGSMPTPTQTKPVLSGGCGD